VVLVRSSNWKFGRSGGFGSSEGWSLLGTAQLHNVSGITQPGSVSARYEFRTADTPNKMGGNSVELKICGPGGAADLLRLLERS